LLLSHKLLNPKPQKINQSPKDSDFDLVSNKNFSQKFHLAVWAQGLTK